MLEVSKVGKSYTKEICDKYGNVVTTGIVTDVALTKGSPFNLFSLTKAMQQGWILGGDNTNGITLTKGTNVLMFDIPIITPKVWCMRCTCDALKLPLHPCLLP
jgi:hypothetical protein